MKKLARKEKKFNGFTVGFDLHKRSISFSIFDKKGDEISSGKFGAERHSLKRFVDEIVSKTKSDGKNKAVQFSMEACGSFLWVYDFLKNYFLRENIHVAQPTRLKAISNSAEKNDKNDAFWLAYYLYERRLPEAKVCADSFRDLRTATREQNRYIKARTKVINAIKGLLTQNGLPNSVNMRTIRGCEVIEKQISNLCGMTKTAGEELMEEFRHLTKKINFWEKEVKQCVDALPEVKEVEKKIPGLGKRLASTVIAELGDPRDYRNAKAYCKAAGLTPVDRSTGGKQIYGHVGLGNPTARWAFYDAVISCLGVGGRNNDCRHVKLWVEKLFRRKGSKKLAIVAAARKLASAVWLLFKHGEGFDLTKVFRV